MLPCPAPTKNRFLYAKALVGLLLVVPWFTPVSKAQNVSASFRHLGTSDGLSEGRITCLLQDSRGFLWVGTFYGLNKYDGYSFKHYYATPHDTLGLQSNVITALCEDSSHTIWVGTRGGGLYALDRRTNNFRHYEHDSANRTSLSSNDVTALLCDSKGRLWVATLEDGLNYFDRASGSFRNYPYPLRAGRQKEQAADPMAMRLFERKSGTIIISGHGQPAEFDPQSGLSHYFIVEGADDASSIQYLCPIERGEGWFYTGGRSGETSLYSTAGLPESPHSQSWGFLPDFPSFMLSGAFGRAEGAKSATYLLGTSKGLFVLHESNHSIEPFSFISREPGNSYDIRYTSVLLDRQGRLWIGTYNGLYTLSKDALVFAKHLFQDKMPSVVAAAGVGASSTPQTVRSLYVDHEDKLFAGTMSGQLFEWSVEDKEFRVSAYPETNEASKGRNPINSIVQDPAGNTWFAVTASGFFVRPAGHRGPFTREPGALTGIMDHKTRRELQRSSCFHPHTEPGFLPPGNGGYSVFAGREGRIWFGSGMPADHAATLHSYDMRSGDFVSYLYPGSDAGHNGMHGVYTMLEDHQNDFWIGTADGLFKLDRTTRKFTSFLYNPADEHSLNRNSITTLHEDSRGRFWVGTWGGGLDLMNRTTGQFTHLMEKDGLPSNIIYSILEDKVGTLWIATGRGICHFNADLHTFSNYDLDDGLLDNEFQPNAAAILPSGEMFFGGNHGVTSFFPEQLAKPGPLPGPLQRRAGSPRAPLAVTSFNAAYALYASELVDGDSVHLNYDQNDLSFEFASLDFSSSTKHRYAYMLQGVDHQWVPCGSRNSGSYNNLSPGSYVLWINSANDEGVWDANGIGIHVYIACPFWGTWWFQTLVVMGVVSLVVGWIVRHRTRERAAQLVLDHAVENERMNIAGDLHDGPLQDLYATRFLLEATPSQSSELDAGVTFQLDTILKKVRGDLRAVTGELQLPRFEHGLSRELALFLESFGEQNPEIRTVREIDDQPDPLDVIAQQNIFRIFRTALANVKKHSDATEIRVRFVQEGRGCTLEIRDNGRGFEVPREFEAFGAGKRYGIILMQAYAKEIGARLRVSSSPGQGTRIVVTYLKRKPLWRRYSFGRSPQA